MDVIFTCIKNKIFIVINLIYINFSIKQTNMNSFFIYMAYFIILCIINLIFCDNKELEREQYQYFKCKMFENFFFQMIF